MEHMEFRDRFGNKGEIAYETDCGKTLVRIVRKITKWHTGSEPDQYEEDIIKLTAVELQQVVNEMKLKDAV